MTWRQSRNMQLCWGLALALLSGCVTVYQPLVGLHRPVAIEPRGSNFKGLRLQLNCHRNDFLWHDEAEQLCSRAAKLFSSQGATVQTTTEGQPPENEDSAEGADGAAAPASPKGAPEVDLRVDMVPTLLHQEKNIVLWVLAIFTATIVPGVSEYTFAQDITVRDADGFLFASDRWQARFIRYSGVAVWGINFLLDKTLRGESERITGDAVSRDFSRDFYRQLNQLVFNAKTRWTLLREPPRASE